MMTAVSAGVSGVFLDKECAAIALHRNERKIHILSSEREQQTMTDTLRCVMAYTHIHIYDANAIAVTVTVAFAQRHYYSNHLLCVRPRLCSVCALFCDPNRNARTSENILKYIKFGASTR